MTLEPSPTLHYINNTTYPPSTASSMATSSITINESSNQMVNLTTSAIPTSASHSLVVASNSTSFIVVNGSITPTTTYNKILATVCITNNTVPFKGEPFIQVIDKNS